MFKYYVEFYKRMVKSFSEDEWEMGYTKYSIKHKKEALKLWVGNGWMFFNGYECAIEIPFIMRLPLWCHYRQMLFKNGFNLLK